MIPAVEIIIRGIILGLAVSMPLGPIGIILINRTVKRGFLSGFFSGLGLACSDTILAFLAALGYSFIIEFIKEERFILSIVAGIIVIAVGIKVFLSNPVKDIRHKDKNNKSLWRDFYSAFALAISNPYTILIFIALFSGINIAGNLRPELVPYFLIPGVLIGAITWWFILSYFVSRFKKKIRLRAIVILNKTAGIVIIFLGVMILLSLFATGNL